MKKFVIAALAFVLYSTTQAATISESSVKDSSVHEEKSVVQDGSETYTTTIYQSKGSASNIESEGVNYHEAQSADKYYKEVCVGTDGYKSTFEEKYGNESDVKSGKDMYTSHYMEDHMKNESEYNPNSQRDTAQYESSKYIENVSDIKGTYKENIYGESVWKSSFSDPGYNEQIYANAIWDSDITKSKNYYESNLNKSDMYSESVTQGKYESDYYQSNNYKEHVADGAAYDESIYGESVLKTRVAKKDSEKAVYAETVWDSSAHIGKHDQEVNTYRSDAYMEIASKENYEFSTSDVNEHSTSVASTY